MTVRVIAPEGLPLPGAIAYSTLEDVLAALSGEGAAVLNTDGLQQDWLDPVAAAIRGRVAPVIEVRSERWDGVTGSPVSGACRGVISGFGARGVAAAVAVLGG